MLTRVSSVLPVFRRGPVVLIALVGIGLGLTGCAGSTEQPATGQSSSVQPGSGQQVGSGSAADELEGIRSTLDAIDSELAGDGSP